jgi:uncharacterized protein (DUF1501 family)
MNHPKYSRRDFVRGGACMVAAGGISSFLPKLNLMGEALAQTGIGTGYKALVCIYLGGGGDSWNMLVPTGDIGAPPQYSHADYVAARSGLYGSGGLAIPRVTTANALPPALALTNTDGNLGVNPFMPEVAALYNSNRLSFIANVGTLFEPITRATYNARKKPPGLYSHNDQTNLWQIGSSVRSDTPLGFGGRIAGITAQNNLVGLSPAISIAGQNRFLVGETLGNAPVFPFQMSTSTTTPAPVLGNYNSGSSTAGEPQRRAALTQLFNLAYPELFSREYKDIFNRSLQMAAVINAEMTTNGNFSAGVTNAFPTNDNFAMQMLQVARMIKISRPASVGGPGMIGANRQVYYVNLGGFDTHDNQITSTTAANGHHGLLQRLSRYVNAFNNAMLEIGADDEVTQFTMSDFGRTINPSNNGTDHAWGSVQFVAGAAISGGQIHGRYPRMILNGQGDPNGECFSRGQFLPTTAVDQVSATLARWMGVDNTNLPLVFPNIDNFTTGPFANAGASPTFANFNRVIPGMFPGIS